MANPKEGYLSGVQRTISGSINSNGEWVASSPLSFTVIITKESGVIYARDKGGIIASASSDAGFDSLLEWVMANGLTSGRTWQETIRIIGDYELSDTINWVDSHVRIELDGRIKVADGVAVANARLILSDGADNCSLYGGQWDSNGINHDGFSSGSFHAMGIEIGDGKDWLLDSVEVVNAGRDAFVFHDGTANVASERIRCVNCTADGSEDDGFNPLTCNDVLLVGCSAKNSVNDGFHLSVGSSNVTFIGGFADGNGAYGCNLYSDKVSVNGLICNGRMLVQDVCYGTMSNCIIDGTGSGGHTLQLNGTTSYDDRRFVVSSTQVVGVDAGERAINISQRRDVTMRDVSVNSPSGKYGIFADRTQGLQVQGCLFDGPFVTANIRLFGACEDTIIRDTTARGGVNGLTIDATTTGTKLSGNDLTGSSTDIVDGPADTLISTWELLSP